MNKNLSFLLSLIAILTIASGAFAATTIDKSLEGKVVEINDLDYTVADVAADGTITLCSQPVVHKVCKLDGVFQPQVWVTYEVIINSGSDMNLTISVTDRDDMRLDVTSYAARIKEVKIGRHSSFSVIPSCTDQPSGDRVFGEMDKAIDAMHQYLNKVFMDLQDIASGDFKVDGNIIQL